MAKEKRDCRKRYDMETGTEGEGAWCAEGSVCDFIWLKYDVGGGIWRGVRGQLMGTLTPCVEGSPGWSPR